MESGYSRGKDFAHSKMIALLAFALLFQSLVSATAGSESLGIHFENGNQDAPLLKLDYATYRATYNETYDVRILHFTNDKQKLTKFSDFCFQKCEICSASTWATTMGKASSAIEDGCYSRWDGGKIVYSIKLSLDYRWLFGEPSW